MSGSNRLPDEFAQGSPASLSAETGQTRIVMTEMRAINARIGDLSDQHKRASDKLDRVAELAATVTHIKGEVSEVKAHARSDFRFILLIFGGAFIVLGGMILTSYLRLEDKAEALVTSTQRVDTKLGDLLSRIPPAPTPPQRR